ncbi:hypothetical protein HanRHA438_Chr10g0465381 [Helianthus annuus]|nr:hypothetical protein HanRHA438_Chr10g0465381 [Helianthus annuus]
MSQIINPIICDKSKQFMSQQFIIFLLKQINFLLKHHEYHPLSNQVDTNQSNL